MAARPQTCALQPEVVDLLELLIRNRDRVVTKDDLIAAGWSGRIVVGVVADDPHQRAAASDG